MRIGCSTTHSHGTYKQPKSKKESPPKKRMVDTGVNPEQSQLSDRSIEPVNVQVIQKQVREAATDPIDFGPRKRPTSPPRPRVKKRPVAKRVDPDWFYTNLYKHIKGIYALPAAQRHKVDELEKQFFNPKGLDIYTEDEAKFHSSTLRKRVSERADLLEKNDKEYGQLEEAVDAGYLQEVHTKAKKTVEVLSEHLEL